MKCPICGWAELLLDPRDIKYEYKARKLLFRVLLASFATRAGNRI